MAGLLGGLLGSTLGTVTTTVGSVTSFLPLGAKEAETHYEKVYKSSHGEHKRHNAGHHYSHEELSAAVGYAVSKAVEEKIASKGGHCPPDLVKTLIEQLTGDELAKLINLQGIALVDVGAVTKDIQKQAGVLLESTLGLNLGLNIGVLGL
ncbi:hypothetical protein BU17DRAFT_86466 [Hysterangium stoloniferum]|nr:hypothetical protein BU17DRAFT_86466 [Hysterangium stoloniferum]